MYILYINSFVFRFIVHAYGFGNSIGIYCRFGVIQRIIEFVLV